MGKRNVFAIICACMLITAFCVQLSFGATQQSFQDKRKQVGLKAERGVGNFLYGWTEIPKRVVDITKESNNPIWGLIAGVYQGTGKAFARTTSGVVDVLTAGIKSDEKPFVQPDMSTDQ